MPSLPCRDVWLQTASHGVFRYGDPADSTYTIADIARSLSLQPRFLGHSSRFLSVAEHSLMVLAIVQCMIPNCDQLLAVHALLHDAHEAFTGDIPSPFKQWLKRRWGVNIDSAQQQLQCSILQRLNIAPLDAEGQGTITIADAYALKLERDLFCNSQHVWEIDAVSVPRAIAELANLYHKRNTIPRIATLFLTRYRELIREVRSVHV